MTFRSKGLAKGLLVAVLSVGGLFAAALPAAAVDTTPPQVNLLGVQFLNGTLLSDSSDNPSLPYRYVWSVYEPGGICSQSLAFYNYNTHSYSSGQQIRQSANGNFFIRLNQHMGQSFDFRLVVQDCAGHTTTQYGYIDGNTLYQEGSATLSPGWTTSTCLCWSAGNVVWNTHANAQASFSFTGSSVAWITDTASNRGSANIYIDGKFQTMVNLQGDGINRIVGYQKRFPSNGSHTLTIVVVGTPNHPRVDIDAFVVNN